MWQGTFPHLAVGLSGGEVLVDGRAEMVEEVEIFHPVSGGYPAGGWSGSSSRGWCLLCGLCVGRWARVIVKRFDLIRQVTKEPENGSSLVTGRSWGRLCSSFGLAAR